MVSGIGSCDFDRMSDINVREQILSLPEHASYSLDVDLGFPVPETGKVCFFSFGFNTTAPDIVSAHADLFSSRQVPSYSDSRVPGWVDEDTVAVLISYDGSEEDILSVYASLGDRGCTRVCVTSSGPLLEAAGRDSVPVVTIPTGMSARSSAGYVLGILCSIVQEAGVCNAADRLRDEIPSVAAYRDSMLDSPYPRELASEISGNVPAIYGTTDFRAAFRRWKMAINEDTSGRAFYGELPEFDHNELVGWFDSNPHAPELRVVVLKGHTGSDLLDFIVDNMVDILRCEDRPVMTVEMDGADPLDKASCAVILGEMVSSALRMRGGL